MLIGRADFEAMQTALDSAAYLRSADSLARGEQEMLSAREVAQVLEVQTPLAFWRAKRGVSQMALGAAAGIPQRYIASLEAGRRKGDPPLIKRLETSPLHRTAARL